MSQLTLLSLSCLLLSLSSFLIIHKCSSHTLIVILPFVSLLQPLAAKTFFFGLSCSPGSSLFVSLSPTISLALIQYPHPPPPTSPTYQNWALAILQQKQYLHKKKRREEKRSDAWWIGKGFGSVPGGSVVPLWLMDELSLLSSSMYTWDEWTNSSGPFTVYPSSSV